ncbi:hypothetical protein HAX54_001156, partial [Datura stramonium]|nr:hypothetical protein [Datura stramonium]
MEFTLKTAKHSFIPPGTLAKGRGKSFRALGSIRVNAEQRPSIGKSKICNTTTYLNELSQNESLNAPPSFDQLEDNVSLPRVVE